MPASSLHNIIIELLEANLDNIEAFLRLKTKLPRPLVRQNGDFIDDNGREFRADLVIGCGEPVQIIIIIEVQRNRDRRKPDAWIGYKSSLIRVHGVPVLLVVISTRVAVGRWAQKAVAKHQALARPNHYVHRETDADSEFLRESIARVQNSPEYSLFQAMLWEDTERQADLIEESWHVFQRLVTEERLDSEQIERYIKAAGSLIPKDVLQIKVEVLMQRQNSWLEIRKEWDDAARAEGRREGELTGELRGELRGKLEGKREGKLEGLATSILSVIGVRGLSITPEGEKLVRQTDSIDKLNEWLALVATTEEKTVRLA